MLNISKEIKMLERKHNKIIQKITELDEHDIVKLKNDFGIIPKGTNGTVIHNRVKNEKVLVEFFNDDHMTIGIEAVPINDLEWIINKD